MLLSVFVLLAANYFTIIHANVGNLYIVQGESNTIDKAPWNVLYGPKCGGVIIGPRWILTTAACGYQKYVKVKSDNRDILYGEMILTDGRYVHGDYDANTWDYNVQLVRLEKDIWFGENATDIKIGSDSLIKDGRMVTLTGFGRVVENETSPGTLNAISVPVTSLKSCRKMLKEYYLPKGQFCAGDKEGHKGICLGDTGGPAVIAGKLVGLISYSDGCAGRDSPAVIQKVTHLKKWIVEVADEYGLRSEYPNGSDVRDKDAPLKEWDDYDTSPYP